MGITEKYKVIGIDKFLTKEWCLRKHYAKRIPSVIIYSFGLYNNENTLQGINTFGLAGNYNLAVLLIQKVTTKDMIILMNRRYRKYYFNNFPITKKCVE